MGICFYLPSGTVLSGRNRSLPHTRQAELQPEAVI